LVIDDNPIADGIYQASEIYSTGFVPAEGTVDFEAGDRIRLDIGTKITAGADASISIEVFECTPPDSDPLGSCFICDETNTIVIDALHGVTEFWCQNQGNPNINWIELPVHIGDPCPLTFPLGSCFICDETNTTVIDALPGITADDCDSNWIEGVAVQVNDACPFP